MKKLKFLLSAVAVLAIAFAASPLQAQEPIKTYFDENFLSNPLRPGLNPEVWNLSACTNVTPEDGPLYFLKTTDGAIWGAWIYDPNEQILQGGMPTPLNGDYSLVSQPIALEADVVNVLTVDFMYATSYLGHTFSVRVRETGTTAWENIMSENPYYIEGESIIATLPSKWSGKTIELAIVFHVNLQVGYPYYFMMGGIRFMAYENKPAIATQNATPPFAQGNDMDVILKVSNPVPVSVSSVSYTYSIDENAEKTLQFPISPSLDMTEMTRLTASISMEGLSFGKHTLTIREYKVNDQDYEGKTMEMEFTYVDASTLTSTYVPVFESFTSSTCGPCATANGVLNPVQDELRNTGALNVIKYQMNWPGDGDPYFIAANQTRMQFYDGVFGWNGRWTVPTPIYNGLDMIMEWGDYWQDIAAILRDRVAEEHQKKALMDIRITQASFEDSKTMNIKFEVTPTVTTKGNVICVIAEGTTTGNVGSNGEKEFHHVALRFPANGEVREFEAGKPETFTYTARMQTTNMEESDDLEILCFVQHESGYIFQSAAADVKGEVANEEEVLGDIRLYPNPATENVTISNLSEADVEMFDIAGRRVYKNEGVNGNLQMALTSFAEGTYVIRITENGKTAHRKLVIVR